MISRFLDLATRGALLIGGVLIVGVVLLTVGDVFARKFFSTGYFGLVDVTQFAVVGFAYLSMPRAFLKGSHVSVELYDHRLSSRADALLKCFAMILAIGVLSILLWYGWIRAERVMRYGDVSQNVEVPMIWYWLLLLVGAAISWLVCVVQLLQNLSLLITRAKDV